MPQTKLHDGRLLAIRGATKADAPALLDYLAHIGGESPNLTLGAAGLHPTLEEEQAYIAAAAPPNLLLLGFVDGQLAADASLTAPRPAQTRIRHTAELGLSVRKAFWGRGIGTAMLQALLHAARQNGQTRLLYLGVRDGNAPAIHLYEKCGFRETGRLPGFFEVDGRYDDEIYMALHL